MTWADFITNDIASRVSAGKPLPARLTLHALCDKYRVSITPVRKAIGILLSKGILVKDKANRLKLNRAAPRCRQTVPILPPSDLFDSLAKDLVLQSLSGTALFLRESTMAKQYKVGRTIIRRIFGRLAGQGVIDHIPRRGWQLRPFSRDDLASFLQVREILELKALDTARAKLEPAVLKQILRKNKQKAKADNSLHSYIIECSGNRYIKDFFAHYGKYYEILFMCEDMDRKSAAAAAKQHIKILNALLKRDWRAAKKALSAHIHINHAVLNTKPELILKLAGKNI